MSDDTHDTVVYRTTGDVWSEIGRRQATAVCFRSCGEIVGGAIIIIAIAIIVIVTIVVTTIIVASPL